MARSKAKGGLGQGLEALFMDTRPEMGEGETGTLPLRDIEPDPNQPRRNFVQEELDELAESIRQHGILQPIAVRPIAGTTAYRIIAGERRWRAARMAGLEEVPVIIKDVTEEQAMELALIENLQREDLDPVEEAAGIRRLMESCGLTQEQAAQKLGKSRSAVTNSLRLLGLPEQLLPLLKQGKLSAGHAKVLLGLPTQEMMIAAAKQVVEQELNVRRTEELCKAMQKQPKTAVKKPAPALATEVEIALREAIGNEVSVNYKRGGRGSLTIRFYNDRQLMQFANLLGQYQKEENIQNEPIK